MESVLVPPAEAFFYFVPAIFFSLAIPIVGLVVFSYFVAIRTVPLLRAAPDKRLDRMRDRMGNVLCIWFLQLRQTRYMFAGVLHMFMFFGFLILSIRSMEMVVIGISPDFVMPGFGGWFGELYDYLRGYAASSVIVVALIAMWRRGITKPARYAVPEKYGKDHTGEAVFVLAMIVVLLVSESLYDASLVAAQNQQGGHGESLPPLSLAWFLSLLLADAGLGTLQRLHTFGYFMHDLVFFSFLCFLPLGKHFHVITSLFNVYFMRLQRGNVKPVRYGISDAQLDDLESFGVKKLEDFTWKHLLDFYSCADCGRCSDNCPANSVGRPLSPRFISIKGRDLIFKNYPLFPVGAKPLASEPLMETIYEEDEIWSCTTCGACEQECPIGIEYIDKIVDLRRGMIDEGTVPQSLQKPLRALEKRGNPWGKLEKKRTDWTKTLDGDVEVKILDGKKSAETLFFVDSITSYDDRMQKIAAATAKILTRCGVDFGILGKAEKDSGHDVRRFGEEMLFQDLRGQNCEAIEQAGIERIVTADPHSYNALKNDYEINIPVEHISQLLARQVAAGAITFKPIEEADKIFTYHDPCYLGRHNQVYEDPLTVLDAIPEINRVDMERCKDRSFCCGGGGLMLFYEPEEEQRMGVLRVQMAHEAGANVVVTACPFCLVNIEDAIKVAGLEGQMEAIDLVELAAQQVA
jgi:Fe-S oxidoreductase